MTKKLKLLEKEQKNYNKNLMDFGILCADIK
jgi:hypothetical protein